MMMVEAVVQAEFIKMNIPHPRMAKAHSVYDNMRQMKVLVPDKPQRCACLFAPTQSGKSKTVETYIETQVVDEAIEAGLFPPDLSRAEIAKRQQLALHVTLDAKATPKMLASAILKKFGDPQAATGNTASLLGRVADYMNRRGTQILFLDEIQHLDDRQTEKEDKPKRASIYVSTAVTDTLKTMLIRGLVPIVFIGVDDAENMILGDPQLAGRCLTKIEFDRLRADVAEEQAIFLDYLGMLGIKLKQHGLFAENSNLIEADIPAVVHKVASGRLGMASNLLAAASTIAREQGAPRVLREHISAAVDDWAIPMEVIESNPFEQGIDGLTRRAG